MVYNKEYRRQYYLKNKDKSRKQSKEYYLNNKEEIKQYYLKNKEQRDEYHKQYVLNNKEKIKQYNKEYYLNNKDKFNKCCRQFKLRQPSAILKRIKLEGDYKQLTINGFDCYITRVHDLHLCGYVKLPNDKKYTEMDLDELNVHGGITYDSFGLKYNGEWIHEDCFFIGFDCGHFGDISYLPCIDKTATYKTMKYVEKELIKLTTELKGK